MKNAIVLSSLILITTFSAQANNDYPLVHPTVIAQTMNALKAAFQTSENLFYLDPDEEVIYVDLLPLRDGIWQIELLVNHQVIGRLTKADLPKNAIAEWHLHNLLDGVYEIKITSGLGNIYSKKIQKNKQQLYFQNHVENAFAAAP